METKKVDLSAVSINASNPRTITEQAFDKLINSLLEFPRMLDLRPIVVDEASVALGGNMRLRALQRIAGMDASEVRDRLADVVGLTDGERNARALYWQQWQKNPVATIAQAEQLTDYEKRQFIIKDNVGFGDWDWDELANNWDGEELAAWGLDNWDAGDEPADDEGGAPKESNVKEDDFDPEQVHETKVMTGEIWTLGAHRLMCGDSTNPDNLKRLLGEVTPDLIYTDPPYGMNAVSNSGVLKEKYKSDIHGDDDNTIAIAAFKLCQSMFPNARQVWWGANYYTECLPNSECWLVWDKKNGMSDQTDCELAWANFRSVVRQFTMATEKTNRIHPTQKPCKLFGDIVVRMKKNDTYNNVLDLFGGSGSTMIACEQMGITSFTMEYDPHFCTEIIARWEKLTGGKAIRL